VVVSFNVKKGKTMKNRFHTSRHGMSIDLDDSAALAAVNELDFMQLKQGQPYKAEKAVNVTGSVYCLNKGKIYTSRSVADRVSVFSSAAKEALTAAVALGLLEPEKLQQLQASCARAMHCINVQNTTRRLDHVLGVAGIQLNKTQQAMLAKSFQDPQKTAELESASSIL
jgi:hypothetical protein